jgi:branched-chain amino acid transport system ATP-binding protein
VLSVRGLSVRYEGSVRALDEVSLELAANAVLAVLGRSGSGKSSLVRAVSGTLLQHRGAVTAGEIELAGRRITRLGPARTVRAGVAVVPAGRRVFGQLTVAENLQVGGLGTRPGRARRRARERVDELFPELARRSAEKAGLLSTGDQQLLAIGRALMSGPELLLLDEPSLGLAADVMARLAPVVRQIHEQGVAVLLLERNAGLALPVAERVMVLEAGRVALSGAPAELAGTGGPAPETNPDPGPFVSPRPARTLSRWVG